MAGINRVWAGISAPPGVTEQKNSDGPSFFPEVVYLLKPGRSLPGWE
jgi:hypothetical protein